MILVVYTTLMKNWRLNNMKKSLLVVPALGVMLLAAAGSVGGTVAWFSSVSSASANVGVFESKATDGNLSLSLAAVSGVGEPNNNGDVKSISMAAGDVLTHASYDHVNKKLCTLSTEEVGGVRDVTGVSNWVAKENFDGTEQNQGHEIYWAVSWTMTFDFTFATEEMTNLYFDPASALTTNNSSPTGDTYKGFRIAFVADGTNSTGVAKTRVWAPYRYKDTSEVEGAVQAKYVKYDSTNQYKYTNAKNGVVYSDAHDEVADTLNHVIDAEYMSLPKITEGNKADADDASAHPERTRGLLGQFTKTGSKTRLVFTCVAWYEGTDPDVTTYKLENAQQVARTMSAVSASLKFYVREATVALS